MCYSWYTFSSDGFWHIGELFPTGTESRNHVCHRTKTNLELLLQIAPAATQQSSTTSPTTAASTTTTGAAAGSTGKNGAEHILPGALLALPGALGAAFFL